MDKDQIIEELNKVMSYQQTFDEHTEEGDLNKITGPLVALQDLLREQIQAETSYQMKVIIQKLKSNAEIGDTDLKLIRQWIVGDAEAYTQMENDYMGWLNELNRLFSAIRDSKAEELSIDDMYKLSGTVRDAIRVVGDIVFFRQEQDRITKFENASKNLDSKNKLLLADILQEELESDQM